MAYIRCKDGQSYSRYDTSDYVQKCINLEKQEIIERSIACDKSQECIDRHESAETVMVGFVVFIFILIAIMVYGAFKINRAHWR